MQRQIVLRNLGLVLIIAMLCPVYASTATSSIMLSGDNIRSISPEETNLGQYYVLELPIPDEIKGRELYKAILELYMDTIVREIQGYETESVLLEIYALNNPLNEELDISRFIQPSPMIRNVRVGENKQIIVDITGLICYYLDMPTKNHGLVIGSLTGIREGIFSIKSNVLGDGIIGKVTFLFNQ